MLWRQQLRAYMADWERSGKDRGALLTGRLLSEADLMFVRRRDDLSDAEARYIEESRTAHQLLGYPQEVPTASPPAAPGYVGASRRRFAVLAVAALVLLTLGAAGGALLWWTRTGAGAPDAGAAPAPMGQAPAQARTIAVPRLIDLSTTAAKTAAEA